MLYCVGNTEKMKSFKFPLVVFILVPHIISLGRCDDISFSICWRSKNGDLQRENGNLWLNDVSLKSVRKVNKVTSLRVSPGVENKLTLQYGGSVQTWTFIITPSTKFIKVRGRQKPQEEPTKSTKSFLESMSPSDVFSCENGTLFFHQEENFFFAIGHTGRLPVKLESRTPSMLEISWVKQLSSISSVVTLYHSDLDSFNPLSMDTSSSSQYRFTALEPCSPYVACVEAAGSQSFTCIATTTDPELPRDFEVTSYNSSSVSLAWACPDNFSFFLLTAFHLNGTDHVTKEEHYWQKDDHFTLSNLEPCVRVKFGLYTVCQDGMESRYSQVVLNDGNSAHSSIEALRQTSFGPDNYTLSWEVRNFSSISMFRVYHEGALQASTLLTNFTVSGLLPCRQYQAKVEAVCGDGVLMSAEMITANTGPHGVSDVRYRSNDSIVQWKPRSTVQPAMAFLYQLSLENGTTLQSSSLTDTELRLHGLEDGTTYVLDVWEECDGHWESERSQLHFEGASSPLEHLLRAAGPGVDLELQFDSSVFGLSMVLPWSLPDELQDDDSEPRAKMGTIFKEKLQEMFDDFYQPVRVKLISFEKAADPNKTEVHFMSFDASRSEEDEPLPVDDQLDYIRSLNRSSLTVADGVVRWDGPDVCAASGQMLCPPHSLCINTLGSHTCVCKRGFYDVSSVIRDPAAPPPVCSEKGLFSRCLDKVLTGGVAKPYLTSHVGGKVEVKLNDGRCSVMESDNFFYFNTSRKTSECGTERQVNKTHIEFTNTLTVRLSREHTISRRDLRVQWKCIYPRHYVRNAHVGVDSSWLSSVSLVAFNSSLQLTLSMKLYAEDSFSLPYQDAIALGLEDTLFLQVDLHTNGSFAPDVLLQVDSCWATESRDPQDKVQGVLLQDGCPVDDTFRWLSINGRAQRSRFSVQMFTMPQQLPIYIHCLANVCGHQEDCTKQVTDHGLLQPNCSSRQRSRRSDSRTERDVKQAAVVSAGPLVVKNQRTSSGELLSDGTDDMMMMVSIVAGSIGFLGITLLSVIATKAVMKYYEQQRLQ